MEIKSLVSENIVGSERIWEGKGLKRQQNIGFRVRKSVGDSKSKKVAKQKHSDSSGL
jgi:hypothetical protein